MKRRLKSKLRNVAVMAMAFVLLFTAFPSKAAEEQIKISDKEYAVVLKNASNVFIGNKTPMSGEVGTKVFLTYTVHEVTENKATQNGVVGTTNAAVRYPGEEGCQIWSSGSKLFQEGYTYIFRLERTEDGFAYHGLKMKDDKVANVLFTKGEVKNDKYNYYGIWTGGTSKDVVSATLTHVRCYDENGNDLGIKSNRNVSMVKVHENGETNNYAEIKGGYYCKETRTLLVLDENKQAYLENSTESKEVSYKVMYGTQLSLMYPEGKEIWQYSTLKITDEAGNIYRCMQDAKVTFVTGEETIVKSANAKTRYRVEKPEDPTKEGDSFVGWYLGNDTEYKFDSPITESLTLYAKWRDGDGHEYLAVGQEAKFNINYEPIIAITLSTVVLAGLVIGYIALVKKRRDRHGQA